MTLRATTHDGTHPRPTMMREDWTLLDGAWGFAHDDDAVGLAERWFEPARDEHFDREITVPFVPESEASGIHDTAFHPVVWYRRTITASAAAGTRLLLHLGAVDHEAHVWVDGHLAGHHVGGQTAFTCDLTDLLTEGTEHVLVVRAHDDPHDVELPRGSRTGARNRTASGTTAPPGSGAACGSRPWPSSTSPDSTGTSTCRAPVST